MLHSFHVAPFFVLHCFYVVPFVHSFHVALFSCWTRFVLHFSHFTLFSCWTLFMLHFFYVVPFSCCTFLCVALLSCCTFSRVASCCTLFMLHFLGIQASNFIKKKLHHKCFPVKFVKILRTPILENICERRLQKIFSHKLSQCKSLTLREGMDSSYSDQKQSSRCVKKLFLEISRNSQENTCAKVSFLIKM